MPAPQETHGGCLCGAVTFTGLGALGAVEVCHCRTCRRHTAGPLMSTWFSQGVRVDDDATLRWYASSPIAARGFCHRCGTTLFWRLEGSETMSVNAHLVPGELGPIHEHVFIDHKPAWYDFDDQAPRVTSTEMCRRLAAWKDRT